MSTLEVKQWQQQLLKAGYYLGTSKDDGDFGKRTLSASMDVLAGHLQNKPVGDAMGEVIVRPKGFQMPGLWMPDAVMKRIIWHWTAGSYTCSELDKEHYHFIIEGDEMGPAKKEKATKLGVPLISEEEFLKMVSST